MVSWLVGALLAVWLLLTVLRNFPRAAGGDSRRDAVQLIPDWALFARPRVEDMVLLRRDLLRDGTLTRWREVDGRRSTAVVQHRLESGPWREASLLALASVIVGTARRDRRAHQQPAGQGTATALAAMFTVPYLTFLRYLSARSHPAVAATQFMIVTVADQAITGRYAATGQAAIEFVSELHRVRPADGRPGR